MSPQQPPPTNAPKGPWGPYPAPLPGSNAPPVTLAPGSLISVLEDEMSVLLNTASLVPFWFEAANTGANLAWTSPPPSGTGAYRTVEDNPPDSASDAASGMWEESTGTGIGIFGTNRARIQTGSFVGRVPALAFDNPSIKWGQVWVGKIISVPTADSFFQSGTIGSDGSVGTIQYPCNGQISDTNFNVAFGQNALSSIVSDVAIDGNIHIVRIGSDGVNAFIKADTESPKTISAIPLYPLNGGALHSTPVIWVDKFGGAVNHIWQTCLAGWFCERT